MLNLIVNIKFSSEYQIQWLMLSSIINVKYNDDEC